MIISAQCMVVILEKLLAFVLKIAKISVGKRRGEMRAPSIGSSAGPVTVGPVSVAERHVASSSLSTEQHIHCAEATDTLLLLLLLFLTTNISLLMHFMHENTMQGNDRSSLTLRTSDGSLKVSIN
jgi:hypothetical protein